MSNKEKIKALMEEFRVLEASDENKRRKSMWKELAKSGRDQFRGTAKFDHSWKDGCIPMTADMQNPTWALVFDFNLKDYYTKPEVFIENYLKIMIYRFKNFEDDTFLEKWFPLWGTTVVEGSLFGLEYGFFEDKDPWLSHNAVIKSEDDLKRLKQNPPSFYTSGFMPELLKMYEGCKALIDDDFEVLFPEWIRSIFGVATYTRGYEDFLVDTMTDEDFAHDLLRFITDVRKDWYRDLAKYTNAPIMKANLYNDEINCPSISPKNYREIVLPYEQELCDFHGGIHYWHSCGDVTELTPEIAKITKLDLFNCGAWTDVYKAGVAFKDKCPLEICMNPQKDILEGTKESMAAHINGIMDACRRSDINGFNLKISALNMYKSLDFTTTQIKMWIDVTKRTLGR